MEIFPLSAPHTNWRQFEEQVRQIPNLEKRGDWYKAEKLASGLWVCIQKNGDTDKSRRSKAQNKGELPHDYLLRLYNFDTKTWVWTPNYITGEADTRPNNRNGLMPDIFIKLLLNREPALEFVDILYDVAAGAEPSQLSERIDKLPPLPGKAIDEILYCFKWLLAQEGINYSGKNHEGRIYPLKRVQEMVDGVDIGEVITRCTLRKPDIRRVNYRVIYDKLGL